MIVALPHCRNPAVSGCISAGGGCEQAQVAGEPTASARRCVPSLAYRLRTWVLTVLRETYSPAAISRLQQECESQPAPRELGSGAIQDRRERRGHRAWVVLGELLRGRGDADVAAFPPSFFHFFRACEGLLGALGVAEAGRDDCLGRV